jgi:hypothetical protein
MAHPKHRGCDHGKINLFAQDLPLPIGASPTLSMGGRQRLTKPLPLPTFTKTRVDALN